MNAVKGAVHVIKNGWPVYPASRSAEQAILDSLFGNEFSLLSEIQEIIDEDKKVRPATTVADFFNLMEEMVKIGEVTQTQLDFIHGVVGKNPNENLSLAAFLTAALAKQAYERLLLDEVGSRSSADDNVALDHAVAINWIEEYVQYNAWREQVSKLIGE
jgi:hypothetical protein